MTYAFFSEIQNINSFKEKNELYESYINKTQKIIYKIFNIQNNYPKIVNSDFLNINGIKYENPKIIINKLNSERIKSKLIPNIMSFCFHGDLISSNIMYDNGKVMYLDPRGDFNKFDISYDIAKMKFSISGYDQVNNNEFKLNYNDEYVEFKFDDSLYERINKQFYRILEQNDMFSNKVIKHDGYWKERIIMHTALQYINNSYIQLKREEIDKFIIMYSIGTIKLNELINRLY